MRNATSPAPLAGASAQVVEIDRVVRPPHAVHGAGARETQHLGRHAPRAPPRPRRGGLGAGDAQPGRGRSHDADRRQRPRAAQEQLALPPGREAQRLAVAAQAGRQQLHPQPVVLEVLLAGRLEVRLGRLVRQPARRRRRHPAVAALGRQRVVARRAPEGQEERSGQQRHCHRREPRPRAPQRPRRQEPERGVERQEVAVGDGAPAAPEVEGADPEEHRGGGQHRERQRPAAALGTEGERAEQQRQEVGEHPDVAAGQVIDEVPAGLPRVEAHLEGLGLDPRVGAVAELRHLPGPLRGAELAGEAGVGVEAAPLAAVAAPRAARGEVARRGREGDGEQARGEPGEGAPAAPGGSGQ